MGQWENALEVIEKKEEEFIRFWKELASIESPSAFKEGVDRAGEFTLRFAEQLGLEGEVIPFEKAGNSISFVPEATSTEKGILLMAHLDTVHAVGSFPEPTVREEDGWLYGPGVFDCKGGVAVALLTAYALKEAGYDKRLVSLFFTGDEEVGHFHSDHGDAIAAAVRGKAAVFNCESGPLNQKLAIARKTAYGMKLQIKGIGAHSGNDPEKGRSAILEASHKVIKIEALNDIFGTGTVVNCGLISGGTVSNAIPEIAEVTVSIRYRDKADAEKKVAKIREICSEPDVPDTHITIAESGKLNDPVLPTMANYSVFELFAKAASELGIEKNEPYFAGGGSDAAVAAREGIPVVCQTGVRGENHHTVRERARIDSLKERAIILTKTILDFPDDFEPGSFRDLYPV